MTSPRKQKTRTALLEAGSKMFWKYGIRKVTVEDICKEAGVSKMTFYRFYENKIILAEKLLTEIYESALQDYNKIMQSEIPFPEKIRQTILLKHQGTLDVSDEFLDDVYRGDEPSLMGLIEKYSEISKNTIREDFAKAQKEGWIKKELKIDFLMYMMDSIGERMFDEKLKAMFDDSHDMLMELTTFFFYGMGTSDNTLTK
ncbi:MAG: TetR/AcrR family transcriptional regulator [Bacteroidetes bacterium HGW-Bacteroidetes-9]|nr:MAG: TetR/AcrR family transcriptional regulator [Bacteroidetes bacterium HGW-Bacteroidetes-9]